MKVYITTTGSYSDYGIDKVFIDKKIADEYFEELKKTDQDANLEEWDTENEVNYVAKEQFSTRIDLITGKIIEGNRGYGDSTYPNRFVLGNKNAKTPEYNPKGISAEWLVRCYKENINLYNGGVFHSLVSQEHANKLAIEEYQSVLRLLNQFNLKLTYSGPYTYKVIKNG